MYSSHSFGPSITPGVKILIIINVVVFFFQMILQLTFHADPLVSFFALRPIYILEYYWVWQIFTYQFLHGGFFHILFNMFALWMFGSELELYWGKKQFIKYYLISGTGAGVFIFLLPILLSTPNSVTLGASGAVFGILLAYAIYWPERTVLVFGIFPLKIKYLVLIIGLISLMGTLQMKGGGGISHIGHLGGLITGYLYLIFTIKKGNSFSSGNSWNLLQKWKMYRQRKRWQSRQKDILETMHMEEKVDYLLEKISKNGIQSLTREEKKFLKKASSQIEIDDDQEIH